MRAIGSARRFVPDLHSSDDGGAGLGMQVDARIEELEVKIAFLERAIQELNDGLRYQQLENAALKTAFERLLQHAQSDDVSPATAEEVPPHY